MANLTPCFSNSLATLLTADLDNAKVSELRAISRGIVKAASSFKGSELRALLIQTRADVMAVIASQPTVTVSEESAPVSEESAPVASVSNTSIADNSTAIELAAIVTNLKQGHTTEKKAIRKIEDIIKALPVEVRMGSFSRTVLDASKGFVTDIVTGYTVPGFGLYVRNMRKDHYLVNLASGLSLACVDSFYTAHSLLKLCSSLFADYNLSALQASKVEADTMGTRMSDIDSLNWNALMGVLIVARLMSGLEYSDIIEKMV